METPADGNSFFCATSQQLDIQGLKSETRCTLRENLVKHIMSLSETEKSHLSSLLETNLRFVRV